MTLGYFSGKFAPLHIGHEMCIQYASSMVDKLYVSLSYDAKYLKMVGADLSLYSPQNCFRWLKGFCNEIDNVECFLINETDGPSYQNDWEKAWDNHILIANVNMNGFHPNYTFSSEIGYQDQYLRNWPYSKHILIDPKRSKFDTSSTIIRQDTLNHFRKVTKSARKDFVKKICIIGTESCGKTTLCNRLYDELKGNCVTVCEVGRTYFNDCAYNTKEIMTLNDYNKIAIFRNKHEDESIDPDRPILIADTNAIITKYYASLYSGIENTPLIDEIIKIEKYDKIIRLNDDVPWVNDGARFDSDRNRTRCILDRIISECGVDVIDIGGGYDERLRAVKNIIDPKCYYS